MRKEYEHINLDYIYDMADDDSDFVAEMIQSCLESLGPNIAMLAEIAKEGDVTVATTLAHKIKGTLMLVTLKSPVNELDKLEHTGAALTPDELVSTANKIASDYIPVEIELKNALTDISGQ